MPEVLGSISIETWVSNTHYLVHSYESVVKYLKIGI